MQSSDAEIGKKKALVIAVSDYNDNQIPQLPFCKNDGEAMYDTLAGLGYEIAQKCIGTIDGEEFKKTIYDFFRDQNLNTKDTLLFYFSGHGLSDGYGGRYFGTTDISAKSPDKIGVSYDYLMNQMERSNALKRIAILDCCYSGAAHPDVTSKVAGDPDRETEKLGREDLKIFEKSQGVCVLASSLSNKLSYFIEDKKMSTFTYYITEGLKGTKESVDEEGYVTPQKLEEYAFSQMLKSDPKMQRPINNFSISGKIALAFHEGLRQKPSEADSEKSILKKPVDFSPFITIRDQGQAVAGLAYSVVYAMEISLAQRGDSTRLSARYIFEKLKTKDENPMPDSGLSDPALSYIIQEFGTVPESIWPYQPENRKLPKGMNWESLNSIAAKYTARTFYLISFDDIFSHLNKGRAIVISHSVYGNFVDSVFCDAKLYRDKKFIISFPDEILDKGSVGKTLSTIVGFDPQTSLFKCAHTFGTGWGNEGFFYYKELDAHKVIDLEYSFAVEMREQESEKN